MQRNKRKLAALHTLEIIEKGGYLNEAGKWIDISEAQQNAITNTILYRPTQLLELIEQFQKKTTDFETIYEINGRTTLDAVREAYLSDKRVVALNFASARNPGGGFLGGSQAQEESIARASSLYPCLTNNGKDYYTINREMKSCIYTDHIIYAPVVPIFKQEDGELMDSPVFASIITAPAVNAGVVRRNEPKRIKDILPRMKQRTDMVLGICQKHGYETLILGAWGCGVFQNIPVDIANIFYELLETKYKNQFKRVIFAIYARNPRFITPFQEIFGV